VKASRILMSLWFIAGIPVIVFAYMLVAGLGHTLAGMSTSSNSIGALPSLTDLLPLVACFYFLFSAAVTIVGPRQRNLRRSAALAHLAWLVPLSEGFSGTTLSLSKAFSNCVIVSLCLGFLLLPWWSVWLVLLAKGREARSHA